MTPTDDALIQEIAGLEAEYHKQKASVCVAKSDAELFEWRRRKWDAENAMGNAAPAMARLVRELAAENATQQARIAELEGEKAALTEKVDLWEMLEHEAWDMRSLSVPTGGDDYEVEWVVISHWMAEPQEREAGRGATPLEALKAAQEKQRISREG